MEKDSNSYYEERPKKVLDDNRVEILPTLNFVNLAKNNKIKREQ